MSIGSITGIGKQNGGGSSSTGLILKKIQKDDKSFCFLADDTVVDFSTLLNFIVSKGGNMTRTEGDGHQTKRTSISCSSSYTSASYNYCYFALFTSQDRANSSDPWSTPDTISAGGVRWYTNQIAGQTVTIDNTWTVIDV